MLKKFVSLVRLLSSVSSVCHSESRVRIISVLLWVPNMETVLHSYFDFHIIYFRYL